MIRKNGSWSDMKINILNIPEEGLDLKFSLEAGSFSHLLPDKEDFDFSLDRVYFTGSIRKLGQSIFFAGTFETRLKTQCDRCLEDAYLPIKADFRYTLLPEVATGEEKIALKTEDLDVGYYAGDVIDLTPIIFEQIMLQIPMKVLCRESCQGLCSRCGINLNAGSCDCHSDFIDERLKVLQNFKI